MENETYSILFYSLKNVLENVVFGKKLAARIWRKKFSIQRIANDCAICVTAYKWFILVLFSSIWSDLEY